MVERADAPRAGTPAKVVDLLVARGTALGKPLPGKPESWAGIGPRESSVGSVMRVRIGREGERIRPSCGKLVFSD